MSGMKFYFLCFFLLLHVAIGQSIQKAEITRYSLKATFNERKGQFQAEASLWITSLDDSIHRIIFTFPPKVDFNSARDLENDKYDKERLPSPRGKEFQDIAVDLPTMLTCRDTVFIKLSFEGELDTSTFTSHFINEREILLQQNEHYAWLPSLSPIMNDAPRQLSIVHAELTLPQEFIVVSNAAPDSQISENNKIWVLDYPRPIDATTAFSFCASSDYTQRSLYSSDSVFSVSFYFSPEKMNIPFADSLQVFLRNAWKYFSSIVPKKNIHMIFANIGSSYASDELFRINNFIVMSNSPKFTMFDSLAFQQSIHNEWLYELARTFCPPTVDSTAWFENGFAGYLSSRFMLDLFAQQPEKQRHERMDVMSNALDFFPSNSLSVGKTGKAFDGPVLSFKGRYVFLMLDFILGRESFDAVIKTMYNQMSEVYISIPAFQKMCEVEYGSSLDWFFQEWIYHTGFPEFVSETQTERNPRSGFDTKTIVTQRGDVFTMPINLVFTLNGRQHTKRIVIDKHRQEFSFQFPKAPISVELDPNYLLLRWLVQIRIYAHAQTSMYYRIYNRDIENSEKEALLTLQLDPNNNTGTNSLAYFSLGKAAMIKNNIDLAHDYFLKAMQQNAIEEIQLYPLLSLVRFANTLEMQDKRDEALPMYQRALFEAQKNPLLYAPVIIDAEKYLREKFDSQEDIWFRKY
jgi:tetratricopeptide (TPR) repeat protein